MIQESIIKDESKVLIKTTIPKKRESLKQRAYLNSITSIIDYGSLQITGMVVSPFIVSGLGSSMYGIWQMLGQMTGYAKLADTRATQVLKWTVANKQDTADDEELRSDVTSALAVTAFILPLVLIAGGIISWYAPYITQADPAYYNLIRITCSLLILSLAISKVFDLFESVLRGMNLGYKRMGFRAGIVVCGGVLKILAITFGYGLIGLSIVQVLIVLATGLSFYFIVKKNIGWFGFGKTNISKILSFGKLSGWYMASTAADTLLAHSDKVILGFIASPVFVSYYALTTFLPLAIQGLIFRVVIGIIPGIGKLYGLKEYAKINKIRGTINDFIFLLTTASGVTIILFNQSFLSVWVGQGYFAGSLANTLIMLIVLQDTFIKHDGFIISVTLDLKKKVLLTFLSGLIFVVLGFVLISNLGIVGLCISILCGKLLLFIGQRKIIRNKIQDNLLIPLAEWLRPFLTSIIMFGFAYYISTFIPPAKLFELFGLVPATFVVSLFIFYLLGLRREKRNELLEIVKSINFLNRSKP